MTPSAAWYGSLPACLCTRQAVAEGQSVPQQIQLKGLLCELQPLSTVLSLMLIGFLSKVGRKFLFS